MAKYNTTQFSVPVLNVPGTMAKVTSLLAKEGINLLAVNTESLGDVAFIRFIPEKPEGVKRLLERAGFQVLETEVFYVEIANRAGELNKLAKALGDAGVNILSVYATTTAQDTAKVALAVDDVRKANAIVDKQVGSIVVASR